MQDTPLDLKLSKQKNRNKTLRCSTDFQRVTHEDLCGPKISQYKVWIFSAQ